MGTLYVVGVGPGDPQLLTLKAARLLDTCPIWFVPSAFEKGGSTALKIASGAVSAEGKTILSHHFPMKKVKRGEAPDDEVQRAWNAAAFQITDLLNKGEDVVFPTLGDPVVYSTAFYVCEALAKYGSFNLEIVPGISAFSSVSAAAELPLCLGDEKLVVIPAVFEDEKIIEMIKLADALVFMKVYKAMDRLVNLLDEFGLVERAVLIEKCAQDGQHIWHDIRQTVGKELHYFSTVIVRK